MMRFVTYPCILQLAESDCGAACLASITKYYGYPLAISHIREVVGTGQQGTTLLGLKRGAEALGFTAQGVKAAPEILSQLEALPLPTIIHWKGYHWVVLYGRQGKKYLIGDPAVGLRYVSKQELEEGWHNYIMLLLEVDSIRLAELAGVVVTKKRSFWRRIQPYQGMLAYTIVLNLVLGLLALVYPFLLQILTDEVLVRGERVLLNRILVAVIVLSGLGSGLNWVQANLLAHFSQRLEFGLVLEFIRSILRLPLTFYETHRSGEMISRLHDIKRLRNVLSQLLVNLPSEFFIAVASLGLLLFYSTQLMLLTIGIAAAMSLLTLFFLPALQQKIRAVLAQEGENQAILVETFKGGLTLKTISATGPLWEQMYLKAGKAANLSFQAVQIALANRTFSESVSRFGSVGLLWWGSELALAGQISIGQLAASYTLGQNVLRLVTDLMVIINELVWITTAAQRLAEVTEAQPERQLEDWQKPFASISSESDIVCEKLNFSYAGQIPLLKNFSLTIPGGKVVALIGESGCGKSTLAKLIAGLYECSSGNIRIEPYNLTDLNLDCWRQQVVLIPQEAHFWSRSIVANFRLTMPEATFTEIVKACQLAQADEFISQLPDKYQTVLGEFGANLSGGQRQRLAIARALIKNPPILILDEATANLDPNREKQVLDELLAQRPGKTTMMITHRPSAIARADWIIFLEEGELKRQGTLEMLREQPGNHLAFLPALNSLI